MGCFNSVCNLSGLPIYSHDKIKLIIHMPNSSSEATTGLVYPSDLRVPMFLPISGEYDDYGAIEKVTQNPNALVLDSFLTMAHKKKAVRFAERSRGEYADRSSIERWIKHINRGVDVSQGFGSLADDEKGIQLSYSMILQDVWDSYLEAFERKFPVRANTVKACDAWFDWYRQAIVTQPRSTPMFQWNASRWGKFAQHSVAMPAPREVSRLAFMTDYGREVNHLWFSEAYFDHYLLPMFLDGSFEGEGQLHHWHWFRDQYAEFEAVCSMMHCIPAFWMPALYYGQDRNMKLQVDLATARHKIASQRLREYEAENEEFEEDDE